MDATGWDCVGKGLGKDEESTQKISNILKKQNLVVLQAIFFKKKAASWGFERFRMGVSRQTPKQRRYVEQQRQQGYVVIADP